MSFRLNGFGFIYFSLKKFTCQDLFYGQLIRLIVILFAISQLIFFLRINHIFLTVLAGGSRWNPLVLGNYLQRHINNLVITVSPRYLIKLLFHVSNFAKNMDPLQIKILSVNIASFKSDSIVFVFEKYILKGQLHNNQLKNSAKNERERCCTFTTK